MVAIERSKADNLSAEFLQRIHELPNGKKIDQCIQCGTCSASCPTSQVMDYSPREIIAALRAGWLERVLNSNTAWFCTSCYSCTVRCPANIPFTDVMYELKRLEIKHKLCPRNNTTAAMARSFVEVAEKYGRNAEVQLINRYYLRTNPFKMLGQMGLALKLFFRGRLDPFPHRIKGLKNLRKMTAVIEENNHK